MTNTKKSLFLKYGLKTEKKNIIDLVKELGKKLNQLQIDFELTVKNKIIICLTVETIKFLAIEFDAQIQFLISQKLVPHLIFINISDWNQADAPIDLVNEKIIIMESKYDNLICKNIFKMKNLKFDEDDLIIFVYDIIPFEVTFWHFYVTQLYQSDGSFVSQSSDNTIFREFKLNESVNLQNSWSIKFKHIDGIVNLQQYLKDNLIYMTIIQLDCLTIRGDLIELNYLPNYQIKNEIDERTLLFNVKNLNYSPESNNFQKRHLDIKYLNSNEYFLTLTIYETNWNVTENYIIDGEKIILTPTCNKQTYLIKTFKQLEKFSHSQYSHSIMQTYETNLIEQFRFYSITSILSNIPDLNYKFFNAGNRIKLLKSFGEDFVDLMNKLNCKAYQADYFRAFYLLKFGGIYFDCKNILFGDIVDLLDGKDHFCKDLPSNYVMNCFIIVKLNCLIIKLYLEKIISNIINENYAEDVLSITGPGLLGKCLITSFSTKVVRGSNLFYDNYITKNKSVKIKMSYNGYYTQSNYIGTTHYGVMYSNKTVFNNLDIKYLKGKNLLD